MARVSVLPRNRVRRTRCLRFQHRSETACCQLWPFPTTESRWRCARWPEIAAAHLQERTQTRIPGIRNVKVTDLTHCTRLTFYSRLRTDPTCDGLSAGAIGSCC